MPYVERKGGSAITATYARPQPGSAEESLPDDHPDVIAYRNPPPPAPAATPLTPEDTERLLLGLGVTRGEINAAKLDRGKPI